MNLASALNAAQTAHRQGDFTQAKKQYLAILKNNDNNDATYGLATILFQQRQYLQAISLFKKLQAREPHAADIALNYALCLQAANKPSQAITVINNILGHVPNDISLIMPLAQIAFTLKSYALTIKLLTIFPQSSSEAQTLLANTYFKAEHWPQAQQLYFSLLNISPTNSLFWQNAAISSAKNRDYQQAITAFSRFIELTPERSKNHLKFADLYLLAKNTLKARKQLDIAIALCDISLSRYELEAKINRLENNYPQAIASANNAINIDSYNAIAWQIKAELGKEIKACISQLSYLHNDEIENNYQNQQNLYTLAKTYESEHRFSQAFDCFVKANNIQNHQLTEHGLTFNPQTHAKEYAELSKIYVKYASEANQSTRTAPSNIFIVGMPRSGTTLVDRLLSQDINIQSSGENEALAFAIEHKLKQEQKLAVPNWQDFFNKNANELLQTYQQRTSLRSNIIVDKMPHNFRYVGAIDAIFNNAKIIQMRRNPQDLALSIFSHAFALEHNYATDLSAIAHAIFQANKLMDFWAAEFPENVINVNYEELVTAPNEIGSALFEFCQLTWQKEYLNFFEKSVSSFTFSELQVRQAINTKKINFSAKYQERLSEFNDTYNRLAQAEK